MLSLPTFINPSYLGALALGAIPILIHLIRKRRIQVVQWAAWEFLLQAVRKNRRRLRIEQILLLIVRVLIVLLLVLVFARPVSRSAGFDFVSSNSRVHMLIVLDGSFSMAYQRGSGTDFERARQAAEEILAKVARQGDSVSLIVASEKPDPLLKEPTFDLGKARERIRQARVTDFGTDYTATAEACTAALANVSALTKEVYFITDTQRSALAANTDQTSQAWAQLCKAARVTWIDVGSDVRPNLSIEPPVFSRELVTPQAPVKIEATVRNYSPDARNAMLVNLIVDDHPSGSARVDVPGNGKALAEFVYLFDKPGVHTGRIELTQPDGLERDGSTSFAMKVRDKLKVLMVDGAPDPDPQRDSTFYLETALSPTSASSGGASNILTTVHNGTSLANISLRQYDAVVLSGVSRIDGSTRRSLSDYVRNGGGIMMFLAPGADAPSLNAVLGGDDALLPASIGPMQTIGEDGALSLNPASINHSALDRLKDTTEVNLGSARFTQVWNLTPKEGDAAARIAVRFSDGRPAIVERQVGQGKVMLMASTGSVSGNNMPFKPAYVPFIHQLVAYLAAGQASQHNLRVGESFSTRFDVRESGRTATITLPNGETQPVKTTLTGDGVVLNFADTNTAGPYTVALGNEKRAAAFAANLDPFESDLASANEGELRSLLGRPKMQFARAGDDLQAVATRNRQGIEIWRTLAITVLILMFLESLLAQRFGRRG